MPLGRIKDITLDAGGTTASGTLIEIEDDKIEYQFKGEAGVVKADKQDIAEFTVGASGNAEKLIHNLIVDIKGLQNAATEVKRATQLLILLAAKDKNDPDIIIRKSK